MGTLILIRDKENGPTSEPVDDRAGNEVVECLKRTLIGQEITLQHLCRSHAVLGILSADGLTEIDSGGTVMRCGEIIKLPPTNSSDDGGDISKTNNPGGARSKAAMEASNYGLVIKVSEDGPISIYKDKVKLIEL